MKWKTRNATLKTISLWEARRTLESLESPLQSREPSADFFLRRQGYIDSNLHPMAARENQRVLARIERAIAVCVHELEAFARKGSEVDSLRLASRHCHSLKLH